MFRNIACFIAIAAIFCMPNTAFSECSCAHTHIGINPTWRPLDWSNPGDGFIDTDTTDDNKLWFFSIPPAHYCATPGWPEWQHTNGNTFLVLSPVKEEEEYITKSDDPNKVLYTCNFTYSRDGGYGDPNGLEHLDGWHSANGPQGAWNLESVDVNTVPAWDIYIQREGISSNLDEGDFFALLPDDSPALETNGETYSLAKEWQSDNNCWGIHEHMGFYFWLDEDDQEVYIVLSVHDAGGMYQQSADYTIRFAKTVCTPVLGDLNEDGIVDTFDLEILIENWGLSGIYSGEDSELHDHEHENED